MSEQRKQHYVPQTYLKNFAGGKKGESLYTLSKKLKKVYPDSVSDAGAERHFYTLKNYEDKYFWDNIYTRCVEPELRNTLKKIRDKCENVLIQENSKVISEDLKKDIVCQLIFQLLRGKQTRAYEKQIYEESLPKVLARTQEHFKFLDKTMIEQSVDKFKDNDEVFKELSMESILSERIILRLARILINYSFVIYKTERKTSFVTSDNPVMVVDFMTMNARPFSNGLLVPTTMLYFPISTKLLLCAYHPYVSVYKELDCSLKIIRENDCERFVLNHNKLQVSQCYNWVYSYSEETLKELIKYI